MTTSIQRLGIDQLELCPLRPTGPIPQPSPVDVRLAHEQGIDILPAVRAYPLQDERYALLQGILTWRAAQFLMIDEIDVMVLPKPDDSSCIKLVEDDFAHCRRKQNPMQESNALIELAEIIGATPHQVGKRLGMTRYTVSHLVRLQRLTRRVQLLILQGRLSLGKAKLLVTCNREQQYEMAMRILNGKWSTQRAEEEIRAIKQGNVAKKMPDGMEKDPETARLEARLQEALGAPVEIRHDQLKGEGELSIQYSNLEILEGILERIFRKDPAHHDWE